MKAAMVAVLALHLGACSSVSVSPAGDGGPDASAGAGGTASGGAGGTVSSGAGGTGAAGGSGGSTATCGPGDQDCLCPGAYWGCVNNRTTCFCPPECWRPDGCGPDAVCLFHDGNCGSSRTGYCQSLAMAAERVCDLRPTCGCDGNLYDNWCAAVAARVSPSAAPTNDCASPPLPCGDPPSASCFPTQYCTVWNGSARCDTFKSPCAQPSCDCIPHNPDVCHCELLPSGLVRLTCNV